MSINQQLEKLSPEKQKLLFKMLTGSQPQTAQIMAIPKRNAGEPAVLSFAQERLWIIDKMEPGNSTYNIASVYRLKGKLNIPAFEKSLNEIIQRHESLRMSFQDNDGMPAVVVAPEIQLQVTVTDIRKLPELERKKRAKEIVSGAAAQPFDLTQAPLIRNFLIQLKDEEFIGSLIFHHIAFDAYSVKVFLEELTVLYEAFSNNHSSPLSELPLHYSDYASWHRRLLTGERLEQQMAFWKTQLGNNLPLLQLVTDHPRPAVKSTRGASVHNEIGQQLTADLRKFCKQEGVTSFITLITVLYILLYRYSGQEDFAIGSPISGRNNSEMEHLIGCFINTLVLRGDLSGNPTFAELLVRVKKTVFDAFKHQDVQFEQLVSELQPNRDLGYSPMFQVLLNLKKDQSQIVQMTGLSVQYEEYETGTSKFDISLEITEYTDRLKCQFEYDTELFHSETIHQMAGFYNSILKEVIANPQVRIAELEMLNEVEKKQLLTNFNATEAEYPKNKTIHQLFEAMAAQNPDEIAVIFQDQTLSYRELNQKANQLGRFLVKKGLQPDQIVGLMVYRSLEMIIGVMGVLKAGGAYLPIDPKNPEERIKYILEDSDAQLLLMQGSIGQGLSFGGEVVNIENEAIYQGDAANLNQNYDPHNLAYVIYTSGSTGKPKGVMIEHYPVINRLHWMQKRYPLDRHDVILQKTPYTFDVSVWELFWWSFVGAKVCFLVPEGEKDPKAMMDAIEKDQVTTIHFVPSMLGVFLEFVYHQASPHRLKSLTRVFASGEALSLPVVQRFNHLLHETNGAKLINLYGPTEATVDVSYYDCSPGTVPANIPIGKPIDNIQLYIVNQNNRQQLQPIGIPGELCIAGDGLARGYLKQPELTAEKFINNHFVPGTKLYRTGDLARWLPDGNIEYLGRIDHQVKIRGFRIELGEIETRLMQHKTIIEAVVTARTDTRGNKYLCAYLVSTDDLDLPELREHLLQELPEYMAPSYFMRLDQMPLTSSGKADRKALPEPDTSSAGNKEYVAPQNDLEQQLVRIWQEVLGAAEIGIRDNFFELGGDSIKAIQISARLNKHRLTMDVKDLFKNPTIEHLAKHVKYNEYEISQEMVTGEIQLTPAQKWLFESPCSGKHHFNQAMFLYAREGFDEAILRQVFDQIMEHHDALRMVFRTEGSGEVIQFNRENQGRMYDLMMIDLTNDSDVEAAVETAANRIQQEIDLANGPLVKLGLFKTGAGDHLLIVIHHLVMDGVSWRILLEDLGFGYQSIIQNEALKLPSKTHSFKKWSGQLQQYSNSKEFLREKEYWRELESREIASLPKKAASSHEGAPERQCLYFKLEALETEKLLKQVNTAYNTEINDLLLTALGLAVKRSTGLEKVLIQLEGHGREAIIPGMNITRTIGWFTSIYPVILDVTESQDISYTIKHIKEDLRRIPLHGVGYGILKYLTATENKQDLTFRLNPGISFNYLGQFDQNIQTQLFAPSKFPVGLTVSPQLNQFKLPLDINGIVINNELMFSFDFNTNEYQESTIAALMKNFEAALMSINEHCLGIEVSEETPADFENEYLSIEELDSILMSVNKL